MSNEPSQWLKPPIQVTLQNPIQKKVYPEGAAVAATTRIANFNESKTPNVNIYSDSGSSAKRTKDWACFIKGRNK